MIKILIGIIYFAFIFAGCGKDERRVVELSVYCVDIWETKESRITRYCGAVETGDVEISERRKKTMVIMKNPTKEIINIPIVK